MTDHLLPPNSTPLERAASIAMARLGEIDTPARLMWDPDRNPAAYLPWLAWALSVDDWDPDWPEETRRATIAASVEVHGRKGTIWAMRRALQAMGYGDATIIEDKQWPRYGAAAFYGGDLVYGAADWVYGPASPAWADYWIQVRQPIRARDATALAARLANVAPARCRLRSIVLAGAYYSYGDGLWAYGDDVTYGGVYHYGDIDG